MSADISTNECPYQYHGAPISVPRSVSRHAGIVAAETPRTVPRSATRYTRIVAAHMPRSVPSGVGGYRATAWYGSGPGGRAGGSPRRMQEIRARDLAAGACSGRARAGAAQRRHAPRSARTATPAAVPDGASRTRRSKGAETTRSPAIQVGLAEIRVGFSVRFGLG
eukprot:3941916-Rhodomonas_salina.1